MSKVTTTTHTETHYKQLQLQAITTVPVKKEKDPHKQEILWFNVFLFTVLHLLAAYGIYVYLSLQLQWKTFIFTVIYATFAGTGVTGGAHRLWAHKCYKAKLPLRIWLMLGQTASVQHDIYDWVRDHRVHHKFTDTDADPHNSTRGFFYCHIGWLMMRKHEQVRIKGKTIDLSDVEADPVVQWQRKYYIPLAAVMGFLLPIYIPVYFWNEDLMLSFYASLTRFVLSLNGTWSVNSLAHLWGYRPYDSTINPVENWLVSSVAFGEGWHNYHHVFPFDYKTAELGSYGLNMTAGLLDFMAYIGQAYDLKSVSAEMIKKRALRTGDGTWKDGKIHILPKSSQQIKNYHFHENCVWGWDDKDLADDIKEDTDILNKKD